MTSGENVKKIGLDTFIDIDTFLERIHHFGYLTLISINKKGYWFTNLERKEFFLYFYCGHGDEKVNESTKIRNPWNRGVEEAGRRELIRI